MQECGLRFHALGRRTSPMKRRFANGTLAAGNGFRARTMVARVIILVTVGKSELGYSENFPGLGVGVCWADESSVVSVAHSAIAVRISFTYTKDKSERPGNSARSRKRTRTLARGQKRQPATQDQPFLSPRLCRVGRFPILTIISLILQQVIDDHEDLVRDRYQGLLVPHSLRPAMIARAEDRFFGMTGRPGHLD
jgi:hypothetical protein